MEASEVKALNTMCAGAAKSELGDKLQRALSKVTAVESPDVANYEIGDIVIDTAVLGSPVLKAKVGALTFASVALSV